MPEAVVGLISDTHMPLRLESLPDAVFEAFAGVDLILHAGDVGELWVLDQLSQCAPVVAVHGNDETAEATQALPYLQTISVAGRRIVLTHAHYPDPADEMNSRKSDDWRPKLARRANFGKENGADIMIFGHTHIPMTTQFDGVWLVNPGALSSPNFLSRQLILTVARMTLLDDQPPQIEFINLNQPDVPYTPSVDLDAGFIAALAHISESTVNAELNAELGWIQSELFPIAPDFIISLIQPLARACWLDGKSTVSVKDVMDAFNARDDAPSAVREKLRQSPVFRNYL
jgi:putative phosphoesterase